jgi:hypothetical protein
MIVKMNFAAGVMRKSAHRSWKVGLFVHVLAAPGSGIASACCHLFPQRQLFHQIVCLHVALSVSLRFPKHFNLHTFSG